MINTEVHKKPVPLSIEAHRGLRLNTDVNILGAAAGLNAFFVQAVEFADVCREYPIVFIPAGKHPQTGKPDLAPMAVFGLTRGENLFWHDGRWQADYVPSLLRTYPFGILNTEAQQNLLCVDESWRGLSRTEGTPLFGPDGAPSELLARTQKLLLGNEQELPRTRAFCQRLLELDLVEPTRFEATLPDGEKVTVDSFFALNVNKVGALPDATVVELQRNGALALIHAQMISMGNMRRLVARRLARQAKA